MRRTGKGMVTALLGTLFFAAGCGSGDSKPADPAPAPAPAPARKGEGPAGEDTPPRRPLKPFETIKPH